MIGPKGAITLDNDDVVTEMFDNDELRRDPVYFMDMQVSDLGSVSHIYGMLMLNCTGPSCKLHQGMCSAKHEQFHHHC